MSHQQRPYWDPRVYALLSAITIGVGVFLAVLSFRTPDTSQMEKTLYIILASAMLPAGVLWTIEHYFLTKPAQYEYESILKQYRDDQELLATIQTIREHNFHSISGQRAPLVERVLLGALSDTACRDIIIVGSTLDGLFRQAWFEQFVKNTLASQRELKLMFTHWDYVTHREKQEDRSDGDIAGELKQSLSRALSWGVPPGSVRLVRGAPTVFMVIAGDNMILNPYPFGRESVTSLSIWLRNPQPGKPEGRPGSIWNSYYVSHYDEAWNPDAHPRRLSTIPGEISIPLPKDWEKELDKFIQGVITARLTRVGPVGGASSKL
jgi:hypothetical protein